MNQNQGGKNIANNTNLIVCNNQQQQNINYHYQQKEQQKQFNLHEEQAIIQYYVYEDFQNFLNLIYSFQAVKQYFKNDPHNIMVQICQNKLFTQMNLSNSIHFDLYSNQVDTQLKQFLIKTKQDLKAKIKHVFPPGFEQFLQKYQENCLNEVVYMRTIELNPIQLKTNFNEKVLQSIFPSIQAVDNKINQIRQTQNYTIPNIDSMKQIALNYQQQTQIKLKNQSSWKGVQ